MTVPDRLRLHARRARQIVRALVARVQNTWTVMRRDGSPAVDRDDEAVDRDDEVEEASRGSFPASDPPAWIGMHAGAAARDKASTNGRPAGKG